MPSDTRKAFIKKLLEVIPEENRNTFNADPEFAHAPPGMSKADEAASLIVPQSGSYTCVTQGPPTSIVVGLVDEIPRWKPRKDGQPVVVNWAALKAGYPSEAHARYATYSLAQATNEWNSHKVGVTFQWVTKIEDAAFVLEYGGYKGTVLASAFFPNKDPLSSLFVYKGSFTETALPYLRNIFLHELGHVLGLRHEFALEKETLWAAVRFGRVNPSSVMSYNFPPNIQPSDVDDTRDFNRYKEDQIGGRMIADYEPDN
jgi:hypothetical protein